MDILATFAITTNIEQLIDVADITVLIVIAAILVITVNIAVRALIAETIQLLCHLTIFSQFIILSQPNHWAKMAIRPSSKDFSFTVFTPLDSWSFSGKNKKK